MSVFPAGNLVSNLPQSSVIFYDKKFRANLKAQTAFVACAEPLELPANSGNQIEVFQYSTLAADTATAAEGNPGSSESAAVVHTTMQIGEYADFLNFSSLSLATAIDNTVENVAKELGYQLGESLSALVRATADGANAIDSSVLVQLGATTLTSFTTLSLNQIRNSVQAMAGRAIQPADGSDAFMGVIHPFALGDISADNSNDAPIDILKHTREGLSRMEELVSTDIERVVEIPSSGVKFYQSNLVTTTANYKGVTGLTALSTYIFGQDGVFRVRLQAPGDTSFGDGQHQNIMCGVYQNVAPSVADPAGVVPAWTSYKVHFASGLSPDATQRLRIIKAASAVS